MKGTMIAVSLGAIVAMAADPTPSNTPPAVAAKPLAVPVAVITSGVGHVMVPVVLPVVPPELLARLAGTDTNAILAALGELDRYDTSGPKVQKSLNRLLAHREAGVRLATLEAIEAIESLDQKEPLLPVLAACLNDPHEGVREAACDIVGEKIESKRALDILVINLTNQYEYIRDTCEGDLQFHTTESFDTPAEWRAWWTSNRASFTF